MADDGGLEALQALHKNLSNTTEALKADREFEARNELILRFLQSSGALLDDLTPTFRGLLERPGRKKESRDAVLSGKVTISDEEYSLNKDFQELTLQIADGLELDEIEAAKLALLAEDEEIAWGRSRKECAIIRFHKQRNYLLNCMLLLLELAKEEDEIVAEGVGENLGALGSLSRYVSENILRENLPGITNSPSQPRFVPTCASTMGDIRTWLQKLAEQVASAAVLGVASEARFQETVEFTYVSLTQQHELLSVILCHAIEKHVAIENDFLDFLRILKQATRYDSCTVHLVPVLGTYITIFGSTEGSGSVEQARKLNRIVCQQSEDEVRSLPFLSAAVRAWWIAEYSGWYMDDAAGSGLSGIDIDEEDKERSKQFAEALRDGAFDFMLAVIADVKASEWEDAARKSLRQWLRKRTPTLSLDTIPFTEPFQVRLAAKLETFVDAFISNMPDVLRRLKIEEDEQRQTSQAQEQDYDLERFLLIIAYSFEGRPEAADGFWGDPENNLAGFLQWASRRATTPVQAAFCEMLQSLSEDEPSAKSAHEFLLDEAHQIRKPLTITWAHIIHELEYFANKSREKPAATQVSMNRAVKVNPEQAETEPEFAAMLESYLRLMAKLAAQSEAARKYLLEQPHLLRVLFQVVSSLVAPRIRACTFRALSALLNRKTIEQNNVLWQYLEACLSGRFFLSTNRAGSSSAQPPSFYMEGLFQEMSPHADDAIAFIQLLHALTSLPEGSSSLRDLLPYPKDLGASTRMRPGIEPYIDFALGHMFSVRAQDIPEVVQQRMLRLCCLEFALTCVSTFNEDLIIFSNETNINVDSAIKCDSLENYVTLHPFARVMEWMYDAKFMKGILDTIHQNRADIEKATQDSPLILSILRAIELISKALDLQATYTNLIRPIVKPQSRTQGRSPYIPVSNGALASIEDGLMMSMALMADLGGYCGIGHPDLTLASLKLLEKISASPRIISVWHSGSSNLSHRNKAIMALEEHNDAATIAGTFIGEFKIPLDFFKESESPQHQTKLYILDFLHSCLQASPDRPTIAHLLLGFRCGASTLEIEPGSPFDRRSSLFHELLPVMIEVPSLNEEGSMVTWLVNFRYKVMRILRILWSSPLSARIVLEELRENDFLFHILMQGLVVQQNLLWDGVEASGPDFLACPAAEGYVDFLSMRAMALEYVTRELCSVSLGHTPALKRRIFDALGGQIKVDGLEIISVPSAFEFQDSLPQESQFATAPPEFRFVGELDLSSCLEEDDDLNRVYNLNKVQEILLLRYNETSKSGQLILQEDAELMELEKDNLLQYLRYLNRFTQVRSYSLKVLAAWTRLLMVMTDCNEFKGTNKVSFILQTLQAMLPSLEMYGSDNPGAALELAKLAKVLLFELDFETMTSTDKQSRAVENLISDKLFQLLQVCLSAIAKWAGNQELRAVYYSICYRHLTGLVDHGHGVSSSLRKTARTIQAFGEKLLNVVCDDAFGGDAACQSAALILLGSLVQLGKQEKDNFVVEALNRLNFIGILVDSLRDVLAEWEVVSRTGDPDQQNYIDAKLALLLQLCQTREGAKNVLHANLFRAIEQSGLFSVDPELQVNSSDSKALERHYDLLVKVARIIGAAIVSRGSHNVLQGRRFLTEHRMLVMHVLKRSAGIGAGVGKTEELLSERVSDLAEAFMVVITATGFLEFEGGNLQEDKRPAPMLFH
ncbi:nucleoporin Nup186/Nup192/Nup205 [Annulohypoxylon truncatum]|uniref:nucleoporin Nup186/Nup192/Nup205 n=1 Tax=Annulohypoxylon truncatum TaxID=327061 RepID=UPI0020088BCD|nr:nucleoporin Nup186/Nup192/Nup205 [Annulohypoxylon truncatum]KAI1212421.1 nucleoporin Nup186/Nup192/Nup205 [Annulohypoxylon truncatum]